MMSAAVEHGEYSDSQKEQAADNGSGANRRRQSMPAEPRRESRRGDTTTPPRGVATRTRVIDVARDARDDAPAPITAPRPERAVAERWKREAKAAHAIFNHDTYPPVTAAVAAAATAISRSSTRGFSLENDTWRVLTLT